MKYLITQEQRDFLIEQMHNARNDQQWLNELKPIEPLTTDVIRSIWESAPIQGTKFGYGPFARAIEAHILGEKK